MDSHCNIAKKIEEGRKIMNKKTLCLTLFVAMLTLCLSGLVAAQETTGSLVGTVRDSNGAAVAGATVTVTEPSRANVLVRTVTTSDDGVYSIPDLKVSTYVVTV